MYDLLVKAAEISPVVGNQGGSYLTMKSNQGLVFGAATILSGFAGVFCDQGELVIRSFQKSISPKDCYQGYWQRVGQTIPG